MTAPAHTRVVSTQSASKIDQVRDPGCNCWQRPDPEFRAQDGAFSLVSISREPQRAASITNHNVISFSCLGHVSTHAVSLSGRAFWAKCFQTQVETHRVAVHCIVTRIPIQAQVTLDALTKAVLAQFKGKASDEIIRVCCYAILQECPLSPQSIMLNVMEHKGGNVTSESWDLFLRRFGPFAECITKVLWLVCLRLGFLTPACYLHDRLQCAQSLYDG
jgi:hypothetical protein